jgi:epoxyqueuosine reductase
MRTAAERIKDHARSLGFALAGIARAADADGFDRLQEWLARGFAGEMGYMICYAAERRHPAAVLPAVRSVVMVAMEYGVSQIESFPLSRAAGEGSGVRAAVGSVEQPKPPSPPAPLPQSRERGGLLSAPASGKIARYAAGTDYHDVLRERLNQLIAWVQTEFPGTHGRGVVDTAPLLERDFARRAGLGWIGKNTMLINKHRGSYFFLGALMLDLELEPDLPHEASHCGTCTACLDACPTDAFAGPGWLDARKCISYLTIELRSPVPEQLRSGVGDWLFGCDICQEVCPWNRKDESEPVTVDAAKLLSLTDDEFRKRYRGTAIERTKRRGLLRNAAIVLGNTGDENSLPSLRRALEDTEPLIRDAAAWAIERIEERQTNAKNGADDLCRSQ